MTRTEGIFAGILLAAIAAAIFFVISSNGDTGEAKPAGPYTKNIPEIGSYEVRFTGEEDDDICTCYEQAFALAADTNRDRSFTSDLYRGGFQTCSSRLGVNGGNAWSYGWNNGMTDADNKGLKSCRVYIAQLRRLQ